MQDGIKGSFVAISVAPAKPFSVAMNEPGIKVGLYGFDGYVEVFTKSDAKSSSDSSDEPLDEAVGSRRSDLGAAMLNVIQE